MPKFMCVKDANSSPLREIWKTTAILSTELLKNHTTENHRCLWDNPAQLSTYIMDPELIWALWYFMFFYGDMGDFGNKKEKKESH